MNATIATAPAQTDALPNIDVRFPATYAWLGILVAGVFFLLGLLIAFAPHHRNAGLGIFIMLLSVAAAVGANYWRKHLHVVAQFTSRQLILRREGAVNWEEITALKKVEVRASYRGNKGSSEFVCINLKTKRPSKGGLEGFMQQAKAALTGYDIIVPISEMSCSADWFVAECQTRMAASGSRQAV